MIKKYILCLWLLTGFCAVSAAQDNTAWNTEKSTHFIVYYKIAPQDFIKQLIERSEEYYNKIADNLGFMRFNFWLWDNRAKIYIYDDAKSYQTSTGHPSWSAGCAIARQKTIQTFPYARGFFETILPHEMGHIIFREFVGFDNSAVPLWLEEGVASYQEDYRRSMSNTLVRDSIKKGTFMDLKKLNDFSPKSEKDNLVVNIFYSEAVSLVDYLIKEFGKDKFVLFCQNLRDKRDFQRAIASVYPFSNTGELDLAWQKYLKNE